MHFQLNLGLYRQMSFTPTMEVLTVLGKFNHATMPSSVVSIMGGGAHEQVKLWGYSFLISTCAVQLNLKLGQGEIRTRAFW